MYVCYNKLIYWYCQLFVNDASLTCYLNLFKHLLSAQLQWIRIFQVGCDSSMGAATYWSYFSQLFAFSLHLK